VSQFLAGKCISTTDHPPYSPDLAPADFWLLPELKSVLKAKCFSDIVDIKLSVGKILTDIPVGLAGRTRAFTLPLDLLISNRLQAC
jgi:hypothetical protein